MARDFGPLGEALMRAGISREEAQGVATMVAQGEAIRHPTYPCKLSTVIGNKTWLITADLDEQGRVCLSALSRV